VLVNGAIRIRTAFNEAEATNLKGGTKMSVFTAKRSEAATPKSPEAQKQQKKVELKSRYGPIASWTRYSIIPRGRFVGAR